MAAVSSVLTREKVTAQQLLCQIKSKGFKRGARENSNRHDKGTYTRLRGTNI
jgi:hypothetical protein